MPKEKDTNRRKVLKLGGASLVGFAGFGVGNVNANSGAPTVDPDSTRSVNKFLEYLSELSYKEQKNAVESLSKKEREPVLDALSNVQLESITTVTSEPVETQSISTAATRLYDAKNVITAQNDEGTLNLWRFTHRVEWKVDTSDNSIIQGSQNITQDGRQKAYPWGYRGVHDRSAYFDSDGLNSREEGLFRYCPSDTGVNYCIEENDHVSWSNISAFPNGQSTKRGGTYKL